MMKRRVILSTVLAAAAATAIAGNAMAADGRGMGMGGRDHDGSSWMGFVMMVAIAALAIGLTWLVIGRRQAPVASVAAAAQAVAPVSPTASAESILADRLARSEITPDEYRATLAALREPLTAPIVTSPPPPAPDAS